MRTLHPSRNILHLNYSSHGTGLTFVEKLVYLLWMSFLVPVFPILLNICMFIDSLPSLLIWLHWEAVYRRGDVQTDLTRIISLFVLTAVQQVLNPVFFSMRRSMRMVVWVLEKSFRSAITSQCPNGVSSQVDQGFMRCITDAGGYYISTPHWKNLHTVSPWQVTVSDWTVQTGPQIIWDRA